jgi:membrane peptidoglycan carboxypeptidase
MWGKKIPYNPEKGTQDTLDRKIREAGVALKLNSIYRNKDSILLAYFNSVDLGYRNTGESIRGFSDASLFYFNKPIEKLSAKDPEDVARIANLTALLRAPARAQSLCDRRMEASESELNIAKEELESKKGDGKLGIDRVREDVLDLKNVRDTLINLISDRGYISKEVAAQAKKFTNYTLFDNKSGFCQGRDASSDYYKFSPIFMSERVREEVRVVLSITKQEEKERGRGIFDNYIVVASLDVDKQDNARRLLERSVDKLWIDKRVPHGALMTMNPKNGEILALVGEVKSPDRKYQYDYAATELIPPASTFKMFFYTAALKGGLPLDRTYPCDSLQFENETFPVSEYSGYCASGNRTIDVKNAVAFSDNLVPLKVAKEYANIQQVVDTARDMGIRSQLEPPVPRMAYGQYKAILREMTGAYAVLANGGKYNFPHAIREIRLNTNKDNCDSTLQKFKNCPVIYDYQKDVRADKQVISADVANKMTELLRGVVSEGTGRNADIRELIGKDIAGKTGTSDGSQDGWFIGYIPNELVTGVWLGNFVQPALVTNPPPTGDFNSADAARVWGDYMLICHQAKGCGK